eukprot:m.356074 g.356074  ORF g.356074 m.356074 type:complete len:165 (+) comp17430_c0_seq1:321-815(+)
MQAIRTLPRSTLSAARCISVSSSLRLPTQHTIRSSTRIPQEVPHIVQPDSSLDITLSVKDHIEGRVTTEELGVVVGTAARSRSFFFDWLQRFRGVVGGSLTSYEELFNNTTAQATHNAMIEAQKLGATSIVRLRYQTAATDSNITGVSCFVICYGTAVRDVDES